MEKLIGLLNEYEYDKRREKTLRWMTNWCLYYIQSINSYLNLKIISKEYGFIKWLVDNGKIKKNYKEWLPAITKNWFLLEWETALLMLLAISDTPIDDLISYLK